MAGTKVGGAEITIERDADVYQISGKAWAEGLFKWLTEWRSLFTATGRVENGSPVAEGYSLTERARNKVKELSLQDGNLTYVKNGKSRTPSAPTTKMDLLSALFLPNGCNTSGDIHNGKDQFSLTLTRADTATSVPGASLRCEFDVRDEDQQRITAVVWLGEVEGLTVPVQLDLAGALEGTLKLRA
ncbi:MAG: DUF3108 domain-containing protein [Gammaproteobacteria bacterium]|nr:DUF3108 domain-containing protein [Gammaproteobacteria bacterium]